MCVDKQLHSSSCVLIIGGDYDRPWFVVGLRHGWNKYFGVDL